MNNNRQKKNKTQANKTRQARVRPRRTRVDRLVGQQDPMGPVPDLTPPFQNKYMTYVDNTYSRNSAGNNWLYFRMRLTGIYDVDPLLLTAAISGFTETGAFYRRWRVTQFRVEWEVSNLETKPLTIVFYPSALDLATVISSANLVLDMAENPLGRKMTLSPTGGMDRVTLRTRCIDVGSSLHGDRLHYLNDTIYSGLGGTSPSNPTSMFFGHFGVASASSLVNGIYSMLKIKFKVHWYERQSLEDRSFNLMVNSMRLLGTKDDQIPSRDVFMTLLHKSRSK